TPHGPASRPPYDGRVKVWIPRSDGLPLLGELPDTVTVEVFDGGEPPSDPADVEFWVPPSPSSVDMLPSMTALKVVQLLSAGAEAWAPHVPDGVTLCNNRGAHTESTAEWAVAAALASVRHL